MGAYLLRRLLLVVPTLLGIILINFAVVQFAPGGPVEQMIAELRGEAVGGIASRISAYPAVRAALLQRQRDFAAQPGGAVLDGRDIGTVICPHAPVKLYVTASDDVRAQRRAAELGASTERTLAELRERDRRDSERATAPLKPAEDAVVLDTTHLSIAEAIDRAIAQVNRVRQG